ncbi:hypothetical protein CDAR_95061 [Caerostris darwini]|uniref:Uncharacterized protein n=1 Tax=Caerostris darwini TaxID=1538125 RepID=A0AAV4PJ08_9ARAC|nr:hypothetical protein CDAR_95061 [Caerostris darwini]
MFSILREIRCRITRSDATHTKRRFEEHSFWGNVHGCGHREEIGKPSLEWRKHPLSKEKNLLLDRLSVSATCGSLTEPDV